MAVFSFIFLILFLGDFVWCWKLHQRLRPFPWRLAGNIGLFTFTGIQVFGLLLLFFGRRWDLPLETSISKPVIAAIYIWHCLVLLPVSPPLASGESLRRPFVARPCARPEGGATRDHRLSQQVTATGTMSRRDFVSAAVCVAPAIVALGATAVAAEQWNQFRIRRLIVPIPHLPSGLDGLTIAQVCDLHVGVFTRGAILDEIVAATNQLHADLVMLPGDLINYSLTDLPAALDVVKRLRGEFGVFVCEGNHDLFENPVAFRERTLAAGLRLLVNRGRGPFRFADCLSRSWDCAGEPAMAIRGR